jgi:selenocysteine lyase/cysteine desulfurase
MLDKNMIERYRRKFPIVKSSIYLDHAGVAPVPLRVKNEVEGFLSRASEKAILDYGLWMDRVEEVRAASAALIGSDNGEIAFIKNTSHGISLVAGGLDWKEGDNVVVTDKEFPANVYPWLDLRRKGVEVRIAPFIDGGISIKDIEELMDSRTRVLSISSVQSVNGFRIDLKRLGELCNNRGVLLFVDAIQSLGAVPMDVKDFGVDFLAADGHKWLLSTEGTGIFYCRKELLADLHPGLIGWMSVENETDFENIEYNLKSEAGRFEEGSYNVMGIHALGASLDMISEIGVGEIFERILGLGELIIVEADKRGFEIKSPRDTIQRGGIVSFAGDFEPSTIRDRLMKSNIVINQRGGALRLAPHFYNTEDEILKFFSELDKIT